MEMEQLVRLEMEGMEEMVGEIVKVEAVEMMVEVVVIIEVAKDMFEMVEELVDIVWR